MHKSRNAIIQMPLIPLLLACMCGCQSSPQKPSPNLQPPQEITGYENVINSLLSTFDHTDILALSDTHWRKADSDLRIALVRNPLFAQKVHVIVVEFATTAYQSLLDRYVAGEDVPLNELQQVWQKTTQTNGVWNSPVYADFFAAVRETNKKLPANQQLRVLAGDPPAGTDIRHGRGPLRNLHPETTSPRKRRKSPPHLRQRPPQPHRRNHKGIGSNPFGSHFCGRYPRRSRPLLSEIRARLEIPHPPRLHLPPQNPLLQFQRRRIPRRLPKTRQRRLGPRTRISTIHPHPNGRRLRLSRNKSRYNNTSPLKSLEKKTGTQLVYFSLSFDRSTFPPLPHSPGRPGSKSDRSPVHFTPPES